MRERITVLFAAVMLSVMLPFVITMRMSGSQAEEMTATATGDRCVTVAAVDGVQTWSAEEFVVWMLAVQIEPDSRMEALKAQAIIARTMLQKAMEGASVADSSALGIEYASAPECRKLWGKRHYDEYLQRLQDAVEQTGGQTLTYEGALIDALYHSISIGTTISAAEAYGQELPYLPAVACSKDVEAAGYMQMKMVTWEEMKEILNNLYVQGLLEGFDLAGTEALPLGERISIETATEHGYVKSVQAGGVTVAADAFAQAAGLESHVYYIEVVGDAYRLVSLGRGHGLGLSQYTANRMAAEGATCQEILSYFYPGTVMGQS